MKTKLFFIAVLFGVSGIQIFAQEHKMLPAYPTPGEIEHMKSNSLKAINNNQVFQNASRASDFDDMIVPGEFEESQAVLITWNSAYSKLQCELIKAIQDECEAWILVNYPSDTSYVKSKMSYYGFPLYRYKFKIKSSEGFWMRDYGPIGFYYDDLSKMGVIDNAYYSNRPKDNATPEFVANMMNIPRVSTSMYYEGGNFMTDGYGRAFYSSRLPENNADWRPGDPWTEQETKDTLKTVYHMNEVLNLQDLNCDGGTGHIDIYLKLLDEQTLVVAEYPNEVTAYDRTTIENNLAYLKTLNSTYGRPYKIHRMYMPTADDGTVLTTCTEIRNDIRGFVNGLIVNKSFIVPVYSNSSTGNVEFDNAAIQKYKQILPGYKIVPIDARALTTLGGAIHCITMQIPSVNPIRFWHPSVEGIQQIKPSYLIEAKIENQSGIVYANCKWREKGTNSWNTVPMILNNNTGRMEASINSSGLTGREIEYYLEAKSNNGKQMTKPMVAPQGYYTFSVGTPIVYCNSKGYSGNEWIANVTVGPINNPSGSNNGYGNFTSNAVDFKRNSSYFISLAPGFSGTAYNEYFNIWIDYNQDGDFYDSGEHVFDADIASTSKVTGSLFIPSTTMLGKTRMRVAMKYLETSDPCEIFADGEVEDYTINIIEKPLIFYNLITLSYCTSKGQNTNDEWIHNVSIGTINNTSGNNYGYINFNYLSTSLNAGSNYSITIKPGWSGLVYKEGYAVWIDFNQDGDFTDAGEQVYTSIPVSSTYVTGNIAIPLTAKTGKTRMRVAMKYNGTPASCETFSYGEVEDYAVNITSNTRQNIEEETTDLDTLSEEISVYPNPSNSGFNLSYQLKESNKVYISVMDLNCNLQMILLDNAWLDAGSHQLIIDEENRLKAGMYICIIKIGDSQKYLKLIKQ